MPPWNDWYHVSTNTYATWLPGDPRGWTTRHARPKPNVEDTQLHTHSQHLAKRPPVRLCPRARRIALDTFLGALRFHAIDVIACAIDDHHAHSLARFPDHRPRHWIGIAKRESARALARAHLAPHAGVWAARSHCKPIRDRPHQLRVYHYIADHAATGAALWLITDPPPREPRD